MGKKRDAKKARRREKVAETADQKAVRDWLDANAAVAASREAQRRTFSNFVFGRGSIVIGDGLVGEAKNVSIGIDPAKGQEPRTTPSLPASITDLLKVEKPVQHRVIPPHARSAKFEDVHEFHPRGTPPSRSPMGLHMPDPPIAFRCPDCDHRDIPLNRRPYDPFTTSTPQAKCRYCGVCLTINGTRVLWWR